MDMTNFCGKCGASLNGTAFCGSCGADVRDVPEVAQPQWSTHSASSSAAAGASPAPPSAIPPASSTARAQAAPRAGAQAWARPFTASAGPAVLAGAPRKTSPIVKLVIAGVIVVFAGCALVVGGLFYAARKVSHKIHEATAGLTGDSPPLGALASSGSPMSGNGCRLLSKEDVSEAIGVTIIRADPAAGGCSYFAQGSQADMTARHMSAMMANSGAGREQQRQIQAFAGGLFKNLQPENKDGNHGGVGEVVVLSFSVDQNSANAQMKLNKGVFRGMMPGSQPIPDLGADAFQVGQSAIMLSKGDKMVRIMYMTCPCGTDEIKPLARKLVAAL